MGLKKCFLHCMNVEAITIFHRTNILKNTWVLPIYNNVLLNLPRLSKSLPCQVGIYTCPPELIYIHRMMLLSVAGYFVQCFSLTYLDFHMCFFLLQSLWLHTIGYIWHIHYMLFFIACTNQTLLFIIIAFQLFWLWVVLYSDL